MRRIPPGPRVLPAVGLHADGVDEQQRREFAAFFVAARQRSGRSLQEIAAATRVAPRHLEALERGAIEALPAGLYRRAIIRDYATSVGIDPKSALEQLDRVVATAGTAPELRALGDGSAAVAGQKGVNDSTWNWRGALTAATRGRLLRIGKASVLPVGAIALVAFGGFAAADRLASDRGAEPPIAAAPLADVERPDVRLPPDSRAAGTSGAPAIEQDASHGEQVLLVTSQPEGARVTIDGIGWGVTPLSIRHLPAGDKVVRLTKDGYVAGERRIRLGAEPGTVAVRVTLRPRG